MMKLRLLSLFVIAVLCRDVQAESIEATDWFEKGMEARYYLRDEQALENFEKAAKLGHVQAQFEVAKLLLYRELNQGEPHTQSLYWFTAAAEAQHAEAQYELALFYMDEYDNPDAPMLVRKWMAAAASNQHERAQIWIDNNSQIE
ncbi:hypothetical protein GT360_08430 [Vibrio astriarenae]|uniref:Sel1 repeat family protein n=1 Tax=Vibrio astriarenae TaxID=1481923 RepID=A0A7Z2YE03_9VIBR|nr:hypothetical protein [Vibrio astriarenae]QIA63545.1 hypothetical protein GT360_08430 [Vibrio astriarenae]